MSQPLYGAIEAGGTKFVCAVGRNPDDLKIAHFPTLTPAATMAPVIDFFRQNGGHALAAIGIGSFGPIDLHKHSPKYGHITSTPKPGWQDFDLCGLVANAIGVPIGFDTDVASSALGEARWGGARGLSDFVYLTIGTGIGGAAVVEGRVLHGLIHSEMGHLRIPHDTAKDPFPGLCPYHGDCLEGLACGPAINARWGVPAQQLPPEHEAWGFEANYIASGLVNFALTLSPQRMILGGGVMQQPHIFSLIRAEFSRLLNSYIQHDELLHHLDSYIVPPALGGNAGVAGCFVLAEQALQGRD